MQRQKIHYVDIWRVAHAAKDHARNHIVASSTHIETNAMELEDFNSLVLGVEAVRKETNRKKREYRCFKPRLLANFDATIFATTKFSLGNCEEYAFQALNYVLFSSRIRGEVYGVENGDHVVLVLNRADSSDPSSPSSWGKAVVCDAWLNEVYKAAKIPQKLKCHETKDGYNYLIKYDSSIHQLVPYKRYNTRVLRRQKRAVRRAQRELLAEVNERLGTQAKKQLNTLYYFHGIFSELEKEFDKKYHHEPRLVILNNKLMMIQEVIKEVQEELSCAVKEIFDENSLYDFEFTDNEVKALIAKWSKQVDQAVKLSEKERAILFKRNNVEKIYQGVIGLFSLTPRKKTIENNLFNLHENLSSRAAF